MRIPGVIFLLLLVVSCNFFEGKPSKEDLINREMKNINWNEVDQYPLFEACDETADKESQKKCFQLTFIEQVFTTLKNNHIVVHKSMNDTVMVQILVSNTGRISIDSIERTPEIARQIPQLDSLLQQSIEKLPKLYPALKRDIPVGTKIKLPIVLKVD